MSFKFNPLTGQLDLVDSGGAGVSSSYIVEGITLDATQALNKEVTLSNTPPFPTKVTLDIISGGPQAYGVDFVVIGDTLIWNGLGLDVTLDEGDKIRIIYPL